MKSSGSSDPLLAPRGAFNLRRFSGDAALVIIGAAVGNAFSYVFHFVLSRKLGPSAYGTLVTLTSIAAMVGVIGNSLGTVAMQETARLWATRLDAAIGPFVRRGFRFIFAIAVATAVALLLASVPLAAYLHVMQPLLWVLLALYVALLMLAGFARGAAQGAHRFLVFAASFAGEGALKVAIALWLVAIGFGVAGTMGGLIAGAASALAITLPAVISGGAGGSWQRGEQLKLGRSALLVLAVTTATNALLFIDMLFAKHHFTPEMAGYFGAAGTVARTIPFAASFIALILMPKAAAARHVGRDALARVLGLAAGMTAACVVFVFAFINVLAKPIVAVTYGPAFSGVAPILRAYTIDEALFALWAIANAYLVAVARYEVVLYLAAATAVEAIAMAIFGSTPLRLLSTAIIVNATLVPVVWVLALRTLRDAPQAQSPLLAENA
jgi:O-antigen/teichoic acid export membrane protein